MTSGSVVLGLVNGILVGLMAVGVVLVYRSNRFLNLAHAQLGVLSVQLLGRLVLDWGWSWWAAFVVCVPVGMAIGVVVDWFLVRPLRERSASTVTLLLVTLGISQILLVFTYIPQFGPSKVKVLTGGYPQPFNSTLSVGGAVLSGADLLIIILVPALVGALGLFLRVSTLGKTIRAAASNPDAARLCGVSTLRVSLVTWAIAGGVSAIGGILQAPTQSSLDAAALGPYLLLFALGAAAFGAFLSIPLALVGGLLLGLVDQLVLAQTSNAGQAELAVLVLVVAIVLARGRAIGRAFSAGGAVAEDRPPLRVPPVLRGSPLVHYQRKATVAVVVAVGALLPLIPVFRHEGQRFQLALVAVYAIIGISLTVAIGWAGQVSLGQFALVGAAAYVAGHLLQSGWSLPLAVLLAGLVAAGFMLLVGLPALRVPGVTLAVTTLGLAVVAPDWLFHQTWFGSTSTVGLDLAVPAWPRGLGHPSGQLAVYYFCLGVLLLVWAGTWALRRSGPGRLVVAVRDNEAAASAFGVTPATVKLAALALSGFLAGAAGALWADAWRTVNANQFTPDLSISVLAIPVIGGVGSLAGAIAAAVALYGFTFFLSPHLDSIFPGGNAGVASVLLFGGLGLVFVLHRYPRGLSGAAQSWWQARLDRMAAHQPEVTDTPPSGLRVEDVQLAFGGLHVLRGASLDVAAGEIVGLIGPNGAGKTTLLNVVAGGLRPDAGRVIFQGVDLTDLDPEMRSAYGLARSFQDARLFPGLTVLETVQVALSNRYRAGMMSSMVGAPWVRAGEADSRRDAEEILERVGLTPWRDTLTSQLSTGTRRICDLAAQMAARPKLLILDEPTAGVAQREAEAFGPLIRRVRAELDCSILVVEHDMPLLVGLCDRIYAMEQGRVIAEGTPAHIQKDPLVIASYLGTDRVAIGRSGRNEPAGPSGRRTRRRPTVVEGVGRGDAATPRDG